MAAPTRMENEEISKRMQRFPEWSESGDSIQRTFSFQDFVEAMKFVNRIAEAAEAAQHHPDILVRWNKVTLTLSTHDAAGITERDFDLASKADAVAGAAPTIKKPKRA